MPFEVPESWEWVTVGDIFTHNTGKALNSSNSQGEIMSYITTSNLYWNRFDLTVIKEMPFTESEVAKCTVTRGDLLVCEGGDIGRAAIWNYDFDIRIQNHIHRLRSIIQLNHLFYYHVFYLFKSLNLIGGKGVAIQGLSSSDLAKLLVPLPPIREQNRIVSELNRWLSVVDQIELDQYSLKNTIADIKNRILCLAISGKLVGQDISDEPAIELLKKINPSYISCDNRHYENLPQNWEECALKDIVEIQNGYAFKSSLYSNNGVRVIRITNVQDGYIMDDSPKYYPLSHMDGLEDYMLKGNDLLMSLTGNVGRVAMMPAGLLPAALNQRVCCITPKSSEVCKEFLFYLLRTDSFITSCIESGKGVAQLNVSTEWLKSYRIALPPKDEQRRIVKAIQNIMTKIDKILADL